MWLNVNMDFVNFLHAPFNVFMNILRLVPPLFFAKELSLISYNIAKIEKLIHECDIPAFRNEEDFEEWVENWVDTHIYWVDSTIESLGSNM
jgi:hypothetical protein